MLSLSITKLYLKTVEPEFIWSTRSHRPKADYFGPRGLNSNIFGPHGLNIQDSVDPSRLKSNSFGPQDLNLHFLVP